MTSPKTTYWVLGVMAVVALGGGLWTLFGTRTPTGIDAFCLSEDSSNDWALVQLVAATAGDPQRQRVFHYEEIRSVDLRTGELGPRRMIERGDACVAPAGRNVAFMTYKSVLEARDTRSGEVVATEQDLLGDLAGTWKSWSRSKASGRLVLTSRFGDDYEIDLAHRTHWLAKEAPTAPKPSAPRALVPLSQYDELGGHALYLACDGSRCQARQRSDKQPVAGADTWLVAVDFCTSSARGLWLVSRLTRLDEATREVSRIDATTGRVLWTLADLRTEGGSCFLVGDDDVVLADAGKAHTQVWLVDAKSGRVRWHLTAEDASRTRVQPFADHLIVGVGAVLYAMPLGDGALQWTARL